MGLCGVGTFRLAKLLTDLGVPTVTDGRWEGGTIAGMLSNEKYKGDFHLQKYYTPENQRNLKESEPIPIKWSYGMPILR